VPYVADATGRGLPAATLARRGVLALLLVLAIIALLLMQYRGVFRSVFPATALVTESGRRAGGRGRQAARRAGRRGRRGGGAAHAGGQTLHAIDLQLKPDMAAGIPAGVTARVVPTNVFGAPSVELLDPAIPTDSTLAGARSSAVTSPKPRCSCRR